MDDQQQDSKEMFSSFLIKDWHLNSLPGAVAVIIFCTVLTLLLEGLLIFMKIQEEKVVTRHFYSPCQFGLAIVHTIRNLLHLLLIQCVLVNNVWVWLSVGLGSVIGYFFLRPCLMNGLCRRQKYDLEEHCPVKLEKVTKIDPEKAYKEHSVSLKERREHKINQLLQLLNNDTLPSNMHMSVAEEKLDNSLIKKMEDEERCHFVRETFQRISIGKLNRVHMEKMKGRNKTLIEKTNVTCSPAKASVTCSPLRDTSFDVSCYLATDSLLCEESWMEEKNADS